MFMENLPKKEPLFREFWAQKPTHMGGTYPYPQHVMYPSPSGGWRTIEVLFIKLPLILLFLGHKSETTCQIDSNKVSNSKLKLDLCNFVKSEMIEPTAPSR